MEVGMGIVVATTHGKIEGVQAEGHQHFRGIPFAAPPIGDARFAAPRPPEPWTGVREASAFGASAPQPRSALPGMEAGPQDEDCLYLNVYTPAADSARRPVMVWIHGGGFTGGSGSQALYEGARLASRGEIVLVTINYRLGALGYLDLAEHADALGGAVSNAGQRDQIAALEWVRDNIESFGGNPADVTIFGESAGGMAVSTLMAMPGARGLFRRVIAQSGAAQATHTRESAARVTEAVLAELGLSTANLEKLRGLSSQEILAAQLRAGQRADTSRFLPFAPVVEPDSLPQAPIDAVRAGAAKEIELIVGANRDEWKLFSVMNPKHFELDEAALRKVVASRLEYLDGLDPDRLIETYRSSRPEAPAWDLLDAIETDHRFRVPAVRLAEAQSAHQPSTWSYLFTWTSPARRGLLGACHALELPFVFGTFDAPTMDRFAGTRPDVDGLSQAMMDAWVRFGVSGDPNDEGRPDWAPYSASDRETMVFGREQALAPEPDANEIAAWEGLL
jgi:para-nitrobenzyl esterase